MDTEKITADERYEDLLKKEKELKDTIRSIINVETNDVTKENANINADTQSGMMLKFASEVSKRFTDEELLSEDVLEYLRKNYIHIHDKDAYAYKSINCLQAPLDKVFKEGVRIQHATIRPPKRIETAATLACITLQSSQNQMFGGQAYSAFDYYLAPFVRLAYKEELKKIEKLTGDSYEEFYDEEFTDYATAGLDNLTGISRIKQVAMNETVRRVHQSMESFIHNMNSMHSRSGGQTTFSSINLGTDTTPEGRCINRELLNSLYEGVGNGETAIFPIVIWKVKAGVNYLPEDRNYDLYQLACKVTARRFFPNFLNLDSSFNHDDAWKEDDPKRYEHEVATMGCRSRIYENRFGPKTSIGRGNLSFTTINIVRLALECMNIENKDERIDVFFKKLDDCLDIVAKQLDERYQYQNTALAKQAPLVMSKLWIGSEKLNPDEPIGDIINQGTLAIGFIGLAECLVALTGKHHGESEESQELGLKIVGHIYEHANRYSEEYKHNYSVIATPAEGLSGKFTKVDRKDFGVIPGVTDRDYYTNSNHVPVYYKISANKKARIEGPYHKLTKGGHIFYVEIDGDATHNPEVVMNVVDLMHKYDMGYGSINHNRSRCIDCGYENADKDMEVCPKCGSHNIDKIARITGYLVGSTSRWNHGKLSELRDRTTHTIENESEDK